jgi:CarD family transcriptional regulator, regulator of rRNA transcription
VKGPPPRQEEKEQLPAVEGVITDASTLEAGDRVVYPNQGVCRITGIETKEIAGQRLELVRMQREEDGAAVLVPMGKVPSIGLRKVATADQIEGVFHYLAAQYDDPELDWKVRHRDNADRLIAGGVLGVAEVVKGLHSLSRIRPLPTKEREQYDNARHLLVHEVAVSLAVPFALAEDYIDYALMPPAGVTFKLKPPPKPVELPVRPRRRVTRTDDEDDLGLDELGIVLPGGDDLTAEIPPLAEGEVEGAVAVEGDVAAIPAIPTPDDIPAADLALADDDDADDDDDDDDEADEGDDDEGDDEGPAVKKGAAKKPAAAAKEKPGKAAPAKKAPAKKEKAEKPAPRVAAKKPAAAAKPKAEKKAPAAKGKKK